MIETIDKMVLDTKILSKIPLESRRIFRLGELYTQELYHESVVEKIMAVDPTGIRFVRVEDYHTGAAF
jgi:RPA family protein